MLVPLTNSLKHAAEGSKPKLSCGPLVLAHTFAGTIVDGSVCLQLLKGPESTQHSPAIVQHLSLAGALDGLRVRCTPRAVATVVTRVLNSQVVRDAPLTAACT